MTLVFAALLLNMVFLSRFYDSHINSTHIQSDMGRIYLQPSPKQTRSHLQTLPCFAVDQSEYFFGSVLELAAHQQHIVVFMLSHYSLSRGDDRIIGPDRIHKNFVKRWKTAKVAFSSVSYIRGQRREVYYCKVADENGSRVVEGAFVTNSYSTAAEVGDTDVLRCPISPLSQRDHSIVVEILRGDLSLVNYSLPLSHRRIGYLLPASSFDAWTPPANPGPHTAALIYGLSTPLHIRLVAYLLQLIQHHVSIGISHIFLFTSYSVLSDDFAKLELLCRPFIQDRQLTIVSEAFDNIHRVSSFHMMTLRKSSLLNIRSNLYLYFLKNYVDYMAIWHIDQFFLPEKPFSDAITLLKSFEKTYANFIVVTDLIVARNPNTKYDFRYPWLDRTYNNSVSIPLNVTEYGLFINTHLSRHILLPYVIECDGRGDMLPSAAPLLRYELIQQMPHAVMYIFETKHKGHDNINPNNNMNDYSARYSQKVNNGLRHSNLALIAQVVVAEDEKIIGVNSEKWPKYSML